MKGKNEIDSGSSGKMTQHIVQVAYRFNITDISTRIIATNAHKW